MQMNACTSMLSKTEKNDPMMVYSSGEMRKECAYILLSRKVVEFAMWRMGMSLASSALK